MRPGITVSTLKEAEHFARAGYRDILYAAGIVPNKLAHAARIQEAGADLILVTDSPDVVAAAARFAAERNVMLPFLIEIDCGEHRGGLPAGDAGIVALARAIAAAPGLRLRGVMTHAGHSYDTNDPAKVVPIAAAERDAAVDAATRDPRRRPAVRHRQHRLDADRAACRSSARRDRGARRHLHALGPGAAFAQHVRHRRHRGLGARRGDRSQSGGPGRSSSMPARSRSRRTSARTSICRMPATAICAMRARSRASGKLAVNGVHQEHGTVNVDDDAWFARLPVGSLVRILPNHACITCAGYEAFDAVRGETVVGRFARVNGW